jgi:CHAT domain-containing protein
VQARLAPDQVILSYQIAPGKTGPGSAETDGGSWVLRITRDEAAAFPLPETTTVEDRLAVFLGLCRRRDGSETEAAELLYADLLGEALRDIGTGVQRLIIVPDGALHQLPFAGLRPHADEAPLGVTHEIAQVPSVRLWLRWLERKSPDERSEEAVAVLAIADPELGHGAALDERLRTADPWSGLLQLGPLPRARTEADRVVRAAPGAGRVVSGRDATERELKQTDLTRYRLLHFATHALVDYSHPERSAIVLAPGGDDEDGFLQMREILELDLKDKIVILSACRSASGTVLQGEGTLGLARAFFQAGARAVVGNLWPLRDDDAEALVGEFSRRLAGGQPLARALAGARASRIEAGAPAAAWAGLVVLGDGDEVPFPDGNRRFGGLASWVLAALGAVLLAGATVWFFFRIRN